MTIPRQQTTFGRAGIKTRSMHPRPSASMAPSAPSAFEFYWPYYVGVGAPAILYLGWLIFAIAAQLQASLFLAAVTLFIGAPMLIAGFLITALILVKMLAGIRGAAGGIGAMRGFALANPGGQLGFAAGIALFAFQNEAVIKSILTGAAGADEPAMTLISFFAYLGVGMLAGDWLYKKINKTGGATPATQHLASVPLPPSISAFIGNWPRYVAISCAGITFAAAVLARFMATPSTFGLASVGADAAFCLLALFVLGLYFSLLNKVLSGAHWLFGKIGDFL